MPVGSHEHIILDVGCGPSLVYTLPNLTSSEITGVQNEKWIVGLDRLKTIFTRTGLCCEIPVLENWCCLRTATDCAQAQQVSQQPVSSRKKSEQRRDEREEMGQLRI